MSRVGKYPVEIPAGVQIAISGGVLTAKGKLGELTLPLSERVKATVDGNKVTVQPSSQQTQKSFSSTTGERLRRTAACSM